MTIPVYRHNQNHDDWEVASVYGSDDCDSLGRSAYDESLHPSGSVDHPALHSQGHAHDARPLVRYSVPQQYQNNPTAPFTYPPWDARRVPGKQSSFIVPPPGVIFPPKDRALPSQDTHWHSAPSPTASSFDRPLDAGMVELPPPSLLFPPSSPPCASSPLIRLPSPTTTITHAMSVTVSGTGMGPNVNTHASPMMPPPPRYQESAHTILPRLADAGCQAYPGMAMSPPRRSGHVVSPSSYALGPGHALMLHGPQSSEDMMVPGGRHGGGHPSYGPGDRPDLHSLPSKYEYEREHEYDVSGRAKMVGPHTRERRPSVWRQFVRRFSPSHVSVGHT